MWKKKEVIPVAVMVLLVGHRITSLVSPWSTMTRRELKPPEGERLVIKSQESCWNGQEAKDLMGISRGTIVWVLALFG